MYCHRGSAGRGPATAMGGMVTIREAAKALDVPLEGATCAIQGYGNVGSFAHRLAHNLLKLKVTAVSDEFGGIYCEGGLDPEVVSAHMRRNGKVAPRFAGRDGVRADDDLHDWLSLLVVG